MLAGALVPCMMALTASTRHAAVRNAVEARPAARHDSCAATGAPHDSLAVIALTDAGSRVVALGGTSGAVLHSFPLGPVRHPPPPTTYPAGALALDQRTCEVIAAAVDSVSGATRVFALSLRDWQLRAVATIADTAGFPWVDVGPSSGRLYLMGRDGIKVVVIDRSSGAILNTVHATRPNHADRYVFRARVSPDERRVYLSYHGGLDWVDLATGTLCPDPTTGRYRGGLGCQEEVHGDFDFFGNDIVTATGGPHILIFDSTGALRQTREMNVINSYGLSDHFMWLSVDARRGIAYGTMYCSLGAGIVSLPIADSATYARTWGDTACGQHIAPTPDGNSLIVLDIEREALTVVDVRSGKTTLTIGPAVAGRHPLDVLGVPVEHP